MSSAKDAELPDDSLFMPRSNLVFLLSFLLFSNASIYGSPQFSSSKLAYSTNGNFVLVLLSQDNLEEYATEIRRSWGPLHLSPEELRVYESNLAKALASEGKIRDMYPSSGLYRKNDAKESLWIVPAEVASKWAVELDEALVANDGSYVVGYNRNIGETEKLQPNKTETGIFIYSTSFGDVSYSVADLTDETDTFTKSSEGYYWMRHDPTLNESGREFVIEKLNGSVLNFSLDHGKLLNDSFAGKPSFCLGLGLLGLALIASKPKGQMSGGMGHCSEIAAALDRSSKRDR